MATPQFRIPNRQFPASQNFPTYRPTMTPEQARIYQLEQALGRPLNEYEWRMISGKMQQVNTGQQGKTPGVGDAVSKIAEKKGGDLFDKLFGGGAAAGGASQISGGASATPVGGAAANAIWNSGAEAAGGGLGQLASGEAGQAAWNAGAEAAGGGLGAAPSGFALEGIGSAGNYFLPAAGVIGGIDLLGSDYGPGRGGLQGLASGAAIGSYFGPVGAGIGAGVGGLIGLGKGLLKHETTRDHAKKNTKNLQGQFTDDATYQAFVRGMRDQYNSAPPDPSKPFAGKYGSWDEYERGGLESGDLTGVLGNLKLGPEYAKLNFDQQKAFTQKMIDAQNYTSKKGEVIAKDDAKARQLFDEFKAAGFQAAPPAAAMGAQQPATMMIPRTGRSPGLDKNGNRISYGR